MTEDIGKGKHQRVIWSSVRLQINSLTIKAKKSYLVMETKIK